MTATAEPFWQHWYEVVTSEELIQGDVFRGLVAYWLPQDLRLQPEDQGAIQLVHKRADWIIVSASCDIARGDDSYVLLSRVLPATADQLGTNERDLDRRLEVVRRGNDLTKFLLAEYPLIEPPFPMSYVNYKTQVLLPIQYVRSHCDRPRLRMKPPFREKLGVWAGSNLSRVAVEDWANIPQFSARLFSGDILNVTEER